MVKQVSIVSMLAILAICCGQVEQISPLHYYALKAEIFAKKGIASPCVIFDSTYSVTAEVHDTVGISGAEIILCVDKEGITDTYKFVEERPGFYRYHGTMYTDCGYVLMVSYKGWKFCDTTYMPAPIIRCSLPPYNTIYSDSPPTIYWNKCHGAKGYVVTVRPVDSADWRPVHYIGYLTEDTCMPAEKLLSYLQGFSNPMTMVEIEIIAVDTNLFRYYATGMGLDDYIDDPQVIGIFGVGYSKRFYIWVRSHGDR